MTPERFTPNTLTVMTWLPPIVDDWPQVVVPIRPGLLEYAMAIDSRRCAIPLTCRLPVPLLWWHWCVTTRPGDVTIGVIAIRYIVIVDNVAIIDDVDLTLVTVACGDAYILPGDSWRSDDMMIRRCWVRWYPVLPWWRPAPCSPCPFVAPIIAVPLTLPNAVIVVYPFVTDIARCYSLLRYDYCAFPTTIPHCSDDTDVVTIAIVEHYVMTLLTFTWHCSVKHCCCSDERA